MQVYAARTVGWRGVMAVHTWIAFKPRGAAEYTRYEVIGWGVDRGAQALRRGRRVVHLKSWDGPWGRSVRGWKCER